MRIRARWKIRARSGCSRNSCCRWANSRRLRSRSMSSPSPIAAGVAFAVRRRKGQRATLAFFGDGTMEEGVFYETLNLAQLWRLPLVFFMENNSVSAHERAGRGSPTSEHAAKALSDVPRAFGVETATVDGTDVEAVFALESPLPQAEALAGVG